MSLKVLRRFVRGAREAAAYSSSSGVEGGARTYFSEGVAASLGFCQSVSTMMPASETEES